MDTSDGSTPSSPGPVTEDLFLGDQVSIRQPRQGYRAGVDAVLLAATVRDRPAGPGTILDIGAGAGTVALCVATRLPHVTGVLLEREPELAALAAGNIARNGLSSRLRAVKASVTSPASVLSALDLEAEMFDQCLANPPYHDDSAGTASPSALKAASHAMPHAGLDDWARFMARMVKPGGRATLIHKADCLPRILEVMTPRFGDLTILPIHPRHHDNAIRVIVEGIKGSRAPLKVRPGFVLHEDGNGFTPQAVAILRHGATLEI